MSNKQNMRISPTKVNGLQNNLQQMNNRDL